MIYRNCFYKVQENNTEEVSLRGVLIRTVSDLQVMRDKYEEGLKIYNSFLVAIQLTGDEVDTARHLVTTGLEVHLSLLSFVRSACQLVGLGTEVRGQEVKEDVDLAKELKSEPEDGIVDGVIKDETNVDIKIETNFDDSEHDQDPDQITSSQNHSEQILILKGKRGRKKKSEQSESSGENKEYACEECGKIFKLRCRLMVHKKFHTDIRPFRCDLCNKTFRFKWDLRKHEKFGHNCKHCGQHFVSLTDRIRHERSQHPELAQEIPENKKIICDFCGYTTNNPTSLKRHIIKHTEEKPHKCEICKKGFNTNFNLRHHMYLHTGEMPFQCDVCSRKFRKKDQLQNHYRLHTGEKPFQCNVCGKAFHLGGERNKHVKKVHGAAHKLEQPAPASKLEL